MCMHGALFGRWLGMVYLPPVCVCVWGGGGCGELCRPYFYKAKCLAAIDMDLCKQIWSALAPRCSVCYNFSLNIKPIIIG